MLYDVMIVGAGPGGIFSAYELVKNNDNLKIAVFESGNTLENVQLMEKILRHVFIVKHVPS